MVACHSDLYGRLPYRRQGSRSLPKRRSRRSLRPQPSPIHTPSHTKSIRISETSAAAKVAGACHSAAIKRSLMFKPVKPLSTQLLRVSVIRISETSAASMVACHSAAIKRSLMFKAVKPLST